MMYYTLDRVLSYNAFLNFLIGERGCGKTFSTTKFVLSQFIKKGYQFAYIRRYKTELKKAVPKFFESMNYENVFPENKFYNKGDTFYCDDKICGYAMTLTTASSLKGDNFPNVKYIIFDEFIVEGSTHHYLSDEVSSFLSLVETIARTRDIKIFMLGNAVSLTNPYFLEFGIELPYNSDIKLYKDGLILINYMVNQEYRNFKRETKFGKLIKGTSYENYAIDNQFQNNNKTFIEHKSAGSKCHFSFIYNDNIYGVWYNYNEGKVYVSASYDKNGLMFATTTSDRKPNTLMLSMMKQYTCWKMFCKNYNMGNVYFESMKIKLATQDILKCLIR